MKRPPTGICVPVTVIRVIDADTIEVRAYSGFRWRLRLADCWCHERWTDRGRAAADYVRNTLDESRSLFAWLPLPERVTPGEPPINPLDMATFNRLPATLFVSDDYTLADLIVRAGHGFRTKAELERDKEAW